MRDICEQQLGETSWRDIWVRPSYSGSEKSEQIRISQSNSFFLTDFFRCARFPDKSDQLQKKSAQLATNTAVRWVRAARWHVFFFRPPGARRCARCEKIQTASAKINFSPKIQGGTLGCRGRCRADLSTFIANITV